jgi:hypothetical protein
MKPNHAKSVAAAEIGAAIATVAANSHTAADVTRPKTTPKL